MLDGSVRFFRPPYGWQDFRGFLVARLSGLQVISAPGEGRRWSIAIPSAFVMSVAEGEGSIDHPTIRREKASSATEQ